MASCEPIGLTLPTVTDPRTSREEMKRIWRGAGGDPIAFYLNAEVVLAELEQYPAAVLEESAADELAVTSDRTGLVAWLERTREVGSEWMDARQEFEATRAARREESGGGSACPRCREPLRAETCACGFRPGWVKAPPRAVPGGELRRARPNRTEQEDIEAAREIFYRQFDTD